MNYLKLILAIAFFSPILLVGQKGTLSGKIFDKANAEGLINAALHIQGTNLGTITDLDGNFSISIEPGTYTISASYVSYNKMTLPNILITAGETTYQDFAMASEENALKEVVVKGRKVTHSESAIISMQKKAPSVINAISTQEISKNGDSQAASALKRVSGVSVEGGKYVYVRGLSDRYSMTTLNRAEIPGLDPNRNTVQMDLFPSNIINSIVVHKTFSAELPGSFSGGYVNIETKDFPSQFNLKFSTSLGFNTNSSLNNNFLTYDGGSLDFLAMRDGSREWPVDATDIPNLYENNEDLDNITRSFNKTLDVKRKTSFLNHSHAMSIGNQVNLGERVLGYNASLSYSRNYKGYDDGVLGRYKLTSAEDQDLNTERRLNVESGSEEVLIGGLLSINLKLNPNHKIGVVGIHNRSGNKTANFMDGTRPSDEIGSFQQTRELSYVQRSISSVQLKGSHYFNDFKRLRVNWMSTYTNAMQQSPDLRFLTNSYFVNGVDTTYSIEQSKYSKPARFSRDMNEFNMDNKVDFTLPFLFTERDAKLNFGFANVYKKRIFEEQRIDINSQNNSFNGNVSEYLSNDNIGPGSDGIYGVYMIDASELRNNYTGYQNVFAAYTSVDLQFSKKIKAQIGVRIENADIFIQSYDASIPTGSLINTDLLPALNSSYVINEAMKLRFAASRTIARPTFRELAPYASYNFATGETRIGNENLERTLVDNIDIRWERFLNPGEILSIGAFYKKFRNPIESTFNPIAANPELTWQNIEEANLIGLEFEFRESLDFIPALSNFKIGTNVTVVNSAVKIDKQELEAILATDPNHSETRVMFGQSPIVFNSVLSYDNDQLGINANINYNVSGKKLAVVIVSGTPNVYEQAFHSLNLNISKKIKDKISMRFFSKNILNSSVSQTYTHNDKDYIFNQFNPGRTYSLGFSYTIN